MPAPVLENVRLIREKLNKSQEQMAEDMGITQPSYARFERGAIKTDLETLERFAEIVNLRVIDLFTYPERYVSSGELTSNQDTIEATLQLRLPKDKKDQVMRLVFGENVVEILNR